LANLGLRTTIESALKRSAAFRVAFRQPKAFDRTGVTTNEYNGDPNPTALQTTSPIRKDAGAGYCFFSVAGQFVLRAKKGRGDAEFRRDARHAAGSPCSARRLIARKGRRRHGRPLASSMFSPSIAPLLDCSSPRISASLQDGAFASRRPWLRWCGHYSLPSSSSKRVRKIPGRICARYRDQVRTMLPCSKVPPA